MSAVGCLYADLLPNFEGTCEFTCYLMTMSLHECVRMSSDLRVAKLREHVCVQPAVLRLTYCFIMEMALYECDGCTYRFTRCLWQLVCMSAIGFL